MIGDIVVARQPVSDDSFYLKQSEGMQYGDCRGSNISKNKEQQRI